MVLHSMPGSVYEMEKRQLQSGFACYRSFIAEKTENQSAQGIQTRPPLIIGFSCLYKTLPPKRAGFFVPALWRDEKNMERFSSLLFEFGT